MEFLKAVAVSVFEYDICKLVITFLPNGKRFTMAASFGSDFGASCTQPTSFSIFSHEVRECAIHFLLLLTTFLTLTILPCKYIHFIMVWILHVVVFFWNRITLLVLLYVIFNTLYSPVSKILVLIHVDLGTCEVASVFV